MTICPYVTMSIDTQYWVVKITFQQTTSSINCWLDNWSVNNHKFAQIYDYLKIIGPTRKNGG